jgi:hypothetical protein
LLPHSAGLILLLPVLSLLTFFDFESPESSMA